MQKRFAHSHKKINVLLLVSFMVSTISTPILAIQQEPQAEAALVAQEEKIFQTIANGYLKSFDQIAAPQPELTLEDLAKNNEKAAVQKVELAEAEKRQIAFAMLSSQSAHKDTVVGPVIDKTFLNKMEVLAGGENSKNSLFNQLNRTETVFGEIALARWLSQPLTDVKALEERQRIVQELINNQELFNTLDAYLKKIKQAQSNAFVYWKAESKINEELYKKLFFGSWLNMLNKSSVALETGTRLDNIIKVGTLLEAQTFLIYAGFFALQDKSNHGLGRKFLDGLKYTLNGFASGVKFICNPNLNEDKKTQAFLNDLISDAKLRRNNHLVDQLTALNKTVTYDASFWEEAKKFGLEKNDIYKASLPENMRQVFATMDATGKSFVPALSPAQLKVAIGGSLALALTIKAYTTKLLADEEILRQSAANNIHGHMIGVATYVDAIKNLHKTIQAQPAFASLAASPAFAQLSGSNNTVTSNFNELLSLLDHNTFKGAPSFFSLTGRVLAAHQIMKETKNEMVPAFELAGELDAYLSVAKLYKEFADKRVKYSFVHFVKADKPNFKVAGFWNPMVNHRVVVANDFMLGSDAQHPANGLVTGPNTGGKSTVLKGILLNLLLAQTLTIAPAQDLTFTPYTKINCYLNVTDDVGAGTSLFKAEVLRAKALINAVRGLTPGQFSFTIMDEMFSGTSPKEGEEAAYMFAEQLGEFDASMLLIATHFPLLADLEDKTTRFKNYQVKVVKDENGKLHRPYKLEEGRSFMNIAMDLLREEGVL